MGGKHQTWPQQWPKQSSPLYKGHHQLDYLTRPKKSSWATNYLLLETSGWQWWWWNQWWWWHQWWWWQKRCDDDHLHLKDLTGDKETNSNWGEMYNPGGHLLFTNSNFTIPGLSSIIQVVTWKIFLTNLDFTIPVLSSFIQVVVTKIAKALVMMKSRNN